MDSLTVWNKQFHKVTEYIEHILVVCTLKGLSLHLNYINFLCMKQKVITRCKFNLHFQGCWATGTDLGMDI